MMPIADTPISPRLAAIRLVGERLCLDFANTVDWHASVHPVELLHEYDDLLIWAVRAKVLDAEAARRLGDEASRRPDEAVRVLADAVALREVIYCAFVAVTRGEMPDVTDRERINAALGRAMAHARVEQRSEGFAWGWAEDVHALDRPLWPVTRSAAELLVSGDLPRVRQCESDDDCGWLFVDTTRNRSRRWCSMESCGNRAKARRHYTRHRTTSP